MKTQSSCQHTLSIIMKTVVMSTYTQYHYDDTVVVSTYTQYYNEDTVVKPTYTQYHYEDSRHVNIHTVLL